MIRLNKPSYSSNDSIDACIEGIREDTLLQEKLRNGKLVLAHAEEEYARLASEYSLYSLCPVEQGKEVIPIESGITRLELTSTYKNFFAKRGKPARDIYDKLLLSAKGRCPFCGGIGNPRNLDHYLPKSDFPQFSLSPLNLIPSCRDCNMDGKGISSPVTPEEQLLQPYFDKDAFFVEQWIFAKYSDQENDEPGLFEYFASPPNSWDETDRDRAIEHFTCFDLAMRYGLKAAELLAEVQKQIILFRSLNQSDDDIKAVLLEPMIEEAPFINHWRVGMAQALIESL